MDDDECPDSTVMMDDEEVDDMVDVPFTHRRSFDEPQSNRISSTAAIQFPVNFTMPQPLPPLPKLIFRPPTQAGNYHSVSFASQQSGLPSRLGSSSTSTRGENLTAPRLSNFTAGRSESFPGTRGGVSQSQRDLPLPRLEPMARSELTISRVSSSPSPRISQARLGVSSTSQNEFARVGGVSISRVVDTPTSLARIQSGSAAKRIAIPPLKRIGGGPTQQADVGDTSRKFGRRFLKSSPAPSTKPQLQAVPKMSMSVMRASSTDEYIPMGQLPTLQPQDSLALDGDAIDFMSHRRQAYTPTASTCSTRKTLLAPETLTSLTSHQGSQGIKLHISKKPVEVIEVDDSNLEHPSSSIASALLQHNPESPYIFLPASVGDNISSGLSIDEVSVKPVTLKVPKVKSRLKIPSDIIIDEAILNEDTKDEILISNTDIESRKGNSRFLIMNETSGQILQPDDSSRRSRRKRQPVVTPKEISPKIRKRRGGASVGGLVPIDNNASTYGIPIAGGGIMGDMASRASVLLRGNEASIASIVATMPIKLTVDTPTRGRGTGRGRGRPRGSTNKAKLERQLLQKETIENTLKQNEALGTDFLQDLILKEPLQTETEKEILLPVEVHEQVVIPKSEETEQKQEVAEEKDGKEFEQSPSADTTSPVLPLLLPLEGDPEVNAEVSSATTPTKSKRGRGRGTGTPRGTPRSSPANRGTRGSKSPRADKKSPDGKKTKEKKEAIKAPPPVQLFEEETRMSADIKPPIPDRITAVGTPTPLIIDEESRASNVSSTSTSTTKAKRFTKDPIEERKPVTAETLYEYQWPLNDKNAEFFFLQEQISEYLGVKSFKRKYPDIRRRVVDMEERDFLRDSKVVSETQCDLGLTAVHSCDVLDIMFNDFTDKYEEYRKIFQDRKDQEMAKLKPQGEAETPAVRDRSAEFMRRILKSCAKWNSGNNRDRVDERTCSFDLQTGTLHFAQGKLKVLSDECTKMGKFPVAVLPGQFTDGYKVYTTDELHYLPLNTVRYGPITENRMVDSDSSDDSSDSDDSSTSNDSSSSSSDEEDSSIADSDQNYITLTDDSGNVLYRGLPGLTKVSADAKCKSCEGTALKNKDGNSEVLLHCSRCDVANHPTCLELTVDMLPFITKYHWECTDCKNCIECNDPADEDKMLFCDCCDRGYHIYCVGLRKVPTGRWHCSVCAVCYSCGVTQPSPEDRMAEWHHEFRKGEKGTKFYLHSFCVACHKLFKKGQFCPSCLKVHAKLDSKDLLECRKCEKWVHRGCVKRPLKSMFGFMCDPCDANFRSRSKLPSHVN